MLLSHEQGPSQMLKCYIPHTHHRCKSNLNIHNERNVTDDQLITYTSPFSFLFFAVDVCVKRISPDSISIPFCTFFIIDLLSLVPCPCFRC